LPFVALDAGTIRMSGVGYACYPRCHCNDKIWLWCHF